LNVFFSEDSRILGRVSLSKSPISNSMKYRRHQSRGYRVPPMVDSGETTMSTHWAADLFVSGKRWTCAFLFSENGVVWKSQSRIFSYVVNGSIVRQSELPARGSLRFCEDNRTKGEKLFFELDQRFAVPLRQKFIAQKSEDTVHIKGHISMAYILHKSWVLGSRIPCPDAQ
jgi:hypothetical protein